jgi:hypothetical protein
MDLGSLPKCPEWLFKLLVALTAIGFFAVVMLIGMGLLAVLSHLRWV